MPERIQCHRGKPLPPGASGVTRGTRWGNPFRIVERRGAWCVIHPDGCVLKSYPMRAKAHVDAVAWYIAYLATRRDLLYSLRRLQGHDLACYCPLDVPCHGDLLLLLANGGGASAALARVLDTYDVRDAIRRLEREKYLLWCVAVHD